MAKFLVLLGPAAYILWSPLAYVFVFIGFYQIGDRWAYWESYGIKSFSQYWRTLFYKIPKRYFINWELFLGTALYFVNIFWIHPVWGWVFFAIFLNIQMLPKEPLRHIKIT